MKNVFHRVYKLFKVITGLFFLVLFTSYNVKAQGHITYGCNSCHIFHNAPGGSLTSLFGNANLCISCHNPSGLASSLSLDNSDKAVPGIGGTSHAWDVLATNSNYETVNPSDPEMVLRLDGGNIICSTCHDQHNPNPSYLRSYNTVDALCKDCHTARDVGRYVDDNTNHKGSHPVGLLYPTGNSDYNDPPTGSVTTPGGNIECSSCHQTHYATTTDGYLLRQTNDDALCAECHTFSAHNGMGCKTCHQTHNTNKANIYMIKDNIVTPNSGTKTAVFTTLTGTNSFADGDGRSAYRGTDGTYTWSSTTGSQTAVYATTPVWGSGTITTCMPCHSGTGNMTDPYTITTPGLNPTLPLETGSHRRGAHLSNSQEFKPGTANDNGWAVVNCFWCHNKADGDDGSPILQGTYGTNLHVDGATHFDPRSFVDGGTLLNGVGGASFSYSFAGSSAHCGAGKTCW